MRRAMLIFMSTGVGRAMLVSMLLISVGLLLR